MSIMIMCFTNFFFFQFLKQSIHKLQCETSNVFTIDSNDVLNYNVENLIEYKVLVAFRIVNMPANVAQNKVQIDLVAIGGNFSRAVLLKAKRDYYMNSIHKCTLTTFPYVHFTVDVQQEKVKKKVYHIISEYLMIGFIFSSVFACFLMYENRYK